VDLDNLTRSTKFGLQFVISLIQVGGDGNTVVRRSSVGRWAATYSGSWSSMRRTMIEARLRQLLKVLQAGKPYEGKAIPLSVSVGVALAPAHASSSTELVLLADLALYESKAKGRGRITLFDEELQSEQRYRRLIERELRAAIYLNELELHYQPIIDANARLSRWRGCSVAHPVRGSLPGRYPIAVPLTLIDIRDWSQAACADIGHLPESASHHVSGAQLKARRRDDVRGVLMKRAARMQFVTSNEPWRGRSPEILRRLETLRNLGFRIALDDFGTGHCGFNYLKTLPIDSIKIDRSYINNLASDRVAQVFVSALAQIARVQDVTIVAEGVETAEEFALARAAGCSRFHGYYISRPAPPRQLRALEFDVEPVRRPESLAGMIAAARTKPAAGPAFA